MENQEEKETSLEYYESKVSLFIIQNRSIDTGFLIDALNEAKKMYEEEIAKAFEKGYIQGAGDYLKPFKKQIWEGAKNRYLKEQYDLEIKLGLNINKP